MRGMVECGRSRRPASAGGPPGWCRTPSRSPSVAVCPLCFDESLVAWGQYWCGCRAGLSGAWRLIRACRRCLPARVAQWEDVFVSGVKLAFPFGSNARASARVPKAVVWRCRSLSGSSRRTSVLGESGREQERGVGDPALVSSSLLSSQPTGLCRGVRGNLGIHGISPVETWLILPVVICLSQRLSHACLSISFYMAKLRMAH